MKANLWSLNIYRQKAGWEGCWQRPSGALFLTSSPSHPHFSKNSSHFGKDWVSEWSRSVMPDSLRPHGLHGLPGSSIHGIFQARVLEWVAISFSRGSSWPRDWTQVSHVVDRRFTVWAAREESPPISGSNNPSSPTLDIWSPWLAFSKNHVTLF